MDLQEKKDIVINGKEFVITITYEDKKYGKIIKAVSKKLEGFEKIFFWKKNGEYEKIEDVDVLKYILDTYEKIDGDIIMKKIL